MKRGLITVILAALGMALSGTSLAQARHDEKPHGAATSSAGVTWVAPATGGRHDEGPYAHRPRKSTAGTAQGPAAAGLKQFSDAEDCCKK
jgi:hypothetical protein